jgi:hypothetical protein
LTIFKPSVSVVSKGELLNILCTVIFQELTLASRNL